jgi:hypothetical protein
MAVSTQVLQLSTAWQSLGVAAPLTIQAQGGTAWVAFGSSPPPAGQLGIIIYDGGQPFTTFTSAGNVYVCSPTGTGKVIYANAS